MNNFSYNTIHPNPILRRDDYLNINGFYDAETNVNIYDILENETSLYKYVSNLNYTKQIRVPFVPGSKLSKLDDIFPNNIVYHKKINIKRGYRGKNIYLNIGAISGDSIIFIDDELILKNTFSYSPIKIKVPDSKKNSSFFILTIIVSKNEETIQNKFPIGVWQSMWLEFTGFSHIDTLFIKGNSNDKSFKVNFTLDSFTKPLLLKIDIINNFENVSKHFFLVNSMLFTSSISFNDEEIKLWTPKNPYIYHIKLTLFDDDKIVDECYSYFSFKDILLNDNSLLISGENVPLNLVYDFGFFQNSFYTQPTLDSYIFDIETMFSLGFNGCFKLKPESPLFYYYADILGFLVFNPIFLYKDSYEKFEEEAWRLIKRDFNHPSIIGFCSSPSIFDEEYNNNICKKYKSIDSGKILIVDFFENEKSLAKNDFAPELICKTNLNEHFKLSCTSLYSDDITYKCGILKSNREKK